MILAALDEARMAEARLHAACGVIGVSARTVQRWTRHPDSDDRRCGPRHRPGNALSAREVAQVLALMMSAEYGHLSPKQLVPRLADEGRYLASESTMYRLRARLGPTARRPAIVRTALTRRRRFIIVPSFSRPHVCNDNPYSEALFRTLKHTPAYPRLPFAGGDAARRWVARFVSWYNTEHRHSAIQYVTPDQRHLGVDVAILAQRRLLYERARRRTRQLP